MRGTADSNIHQMYQLADIHDNGDIGTIGMAKALQSSGALMKNVAVDEGDCGFLPNKSLKPHSPGIIEPHHHLMLIDDCTVAPVQENATVAHHRTGVVSSSSALCCVAVVDRILDCGEQSLHHLRLKALLGRHPRIHQQTEPGPEGYVLGSSSQCTPLWVSSPSAAAQLSPLLQILMLVIVMIFVAAAEVVSFR